MLAEPAWSSDSCHTQPSLSPDREAELLEQYAYLINRAASHMHSLTGAVIDRDDLRQVGMMALLSSIRRFGRDIDEQFAAYAFKRIRGAMLDQFRQLDWRPRRLRQEAHQLRDAERELNKQLGQQASEAQLCEQLGITEDRLTELRYVLQAEVLESFNELLEANKEQQLGSSNMVGVERSLALQKAISTLTKREQLMLTLYYQKELNMKEIALVLNLTESRVCQLHKLAVEKLVGRLSP